MDLLLPIPCFCTYGLALMPTTLPRRLTRALGGNLTPGRLRDILLGLLHSTTPGMIAKIRKGPTAFTTAKLPYDLLDVTTFPS